MRMGILLLIFTKIDFLTNNAYAMGLNYRHLDFRYLLLEVGTARRIAAMSEMMTISTLAMKLLCKMDMEKETSDIYIGEKSERTEGPVSCNSKDTKGSKEVDIPDPISEGNTMNMKETDDAPSESNFPEESSNLTDNELLPRTEIRLAQFKNGTLIIGFRGSDDEADWLDNFCFTLVSKDNGNQNTAKFHKGFLERANKIFNHQTHRGTLVDEVKHRYRDHPGGLPNRIVTTGHSLGGAISQLIHIRLHEVDEISQKCELLNITWATPMIGNYAARQLLSSEAKTMFHYVHKSDIVPALLFDVNGVYKNLPTVITKKEIKKQIDKLASANDGLAERAEEVKTLVDLLSEGEMEDDLSYTAIGNYRQISRRVPRGAPGFEGEFRYDEAHDNVNISLAKALKNAVKDVSSSSVAWTFMSAKLGYETSETKLGKEIEEIKENHSLKIYEQLCRPLLQPEDAKCPHVMRTLEICKETYDENNERRIPRGHTWCVLSEETYVVPYRAGL